MKTRNRHQGGVLITVVIVLIVSTVIVGTLVSSAVAEKRFNSHTYTTTQARLVTEQLAEGAVGHIMRATQRGVMLNANHFGKNPPPVPAASTLGKLPTTKALPLSDGSTASVRGYEVSDVGLFVGAMSAPDVIDVAFGDTLYPQTMWGQLVRRKAVTVLARSTVTDASGARSTSHMKLRLNLLETGPYDKMPFYLPSMEIANSPPLTLDGLAYVQGDAFLSGGGGSQIYQQGIAATGNIYYGRDPMRVASQGNSLATVQIRNPLTKSLVNWPSNLNPTSSSGATLSKDWEKRMADLFGGAVRPNSYPLAIPGDIRYKPDNPATKDVNERINSGHDLIEPQITDTKSPDYNPVLESNKFSNAAGLRIVHDYKVKDGKVESETIRGYKPKAENDDGIVTEWVEVALPPKLATTVSDRVATMKDSRRGEAVRTLDLDVGVLRQAVELVGTERFPTGTSGKETFDPVEDWNGVVYVESTSLDASGVRIVNASRIPNRDGESTTTPNGLTLASNNAMYLHGNFNADGDTATGSAGFPDYYDINTSTNEGTPSKSKTRTEWPAALVADAITVLSPGFDPKASLKTDKPTASGFVEVSAAFVAGIVPSTSKSYSGGVENFPRFLEDWSGKTFRYRGSFVCLFESEVAPEPWANAAYAPPAREWGLNRMFKTESPQHSLSSANAQRVRYELLTPAEFQAEYQALRTELISKGVSEDSLPSL